MRCMGGGGHNIRHHIINTRRCFPSPLCIAPLLKVRDIHIKLYDHRA